MLQPDCKYCARSADLFEIAEDIADLEVSNLYLLKDQSHRGRCILAFRDHKTELFQLTPEELTAFSRDAAAAARAIHEAFSPDKINYAAYGDTAPHLHLHIVPKYKGGKSWGSPFELAPSEAGIPSEEERKKIIHEIKSRL